MFEEIPEQFVAQQFVKGKTTKKATKAFLAGVAEKDFDEDRDDSTIHDRHEREKKNDRGDDNPDYKEDPEDRKVYINLVEGGIKDLEDGDWVMKSTRRDSKQFVLSDKEFQARFRKVKGK